MPDDPRTDTPSPFTSRFVGDSPFGQGTLWDAYGNYISAEDRAIKKEVESAGEQERLGKEDIAARRLMRGNITDAMARRRADAAAYPEQQAPPEPPKPEDYHKMSLGYLASMVLVGMFAGKMVRNAGNAPIAAFGGAAKGWNIGNLEAYKEAAEEWEKSNRRALEMNRQRMEKYRHILENDSLGIEDQMNQYKMVSMEYQDRIGFDAANSKNWNGIAQHYAANVTAHEKWEDHTQKIVDTMTQQTEQAQGNADRVRDYLGTPQGQQWFQQFTPAQKIQIKGFLDAYPAAPAPAEPREQTFADQPRTGVVPREAPGAGAAGAAQMPPDLRGPQPMNMKPSEAQYRQLRIRSWQEHGREPTPEEVGAAARKSHPSRSVAGMQIENENERREAAGLPPLTTAEEQQLIAEGRYATSAMGAAGGLAGRQAGAFAAFKRTLPQASEASTAVGARSKWVPYNRLKQDVQLQASNPVYQDFVIANETAITDYAMAIGRGGGMTVHAQQRAAKLLNTALSDEAYQTALRRLEKEADAVSRAPAYAKRELLHQLFPNAPQADIDEAVSESVLPPAPAGQQGEGRTRRPAAPDEGWSNFRVQ